MLDLDQLAAIRRHELDHLVGEILPPAQVLDFGAGTGDQAAALAAMGFDVEAVDIETSIYRSKGAFPIRWYDGHKLPFPDASFDVIFSSSVLEHLTNPAEVHSELKRVLKSDGIMVHAVPSTVWRFWTTAAEFVDAWRIAFQRVPTLLPQDLTIAELRRVALTAIKLVGRLLWPLLFVRHGEQGNALTELGSFNSRAWRRYFRWHGYRVHRMDPIPVFYTGVNLFGSRLSLSTRAKLARRIFGGTCVRFEIEPVPNSITPFDKDGTNTP